MGRVAENKKYPFHLPLETEILWSLQCLNLCHPVIRTIWNAAGLSPLLTKLFVVLRLPWQKQSISRSAQRHSVTRIKGCISSWLSVRENKCPHFFYCFYFVSCVLVVPDLCCWSCAQAGKELEKNKSLKKVQTCETTAWKVEFQVLLRRLLLNEQITHEWHRAVSPNFPGNLHCTFKINNNEIWPEWSSMKGIRSLS